MAGNTNQTGANLFGPYSTTLDAYMVDSDGYMYYAKGTGVPPTTASIFAHGCKYIQTDSGTGNIAEWTNTGSTATPVWNLMAALPSTATSSSASSSAVLKTTLTSVQIKNLNGTPIAIVPNPGAGKIAVIEDISLYNTFGTVAYTGNSIEVRYTGGSGAKVMTDIGSSFLSSATSTAIVEGALTTNVVAVLNASIFVVVPTANPATGDGTITVTAKYRVADTV